MPNPLARKLDRLVNLTDQERQALERLPVTVRTLQPRVDIVRQGDRPAGCAVVVEGWTCRYRLLAEGRRQIIAFHIDHDAAELQSLHLPVMDHGISTLTTATVAFIAHQDLRDVIARHAGIGTALWRDTLLDAAILRERLVCIGRRTAYQKIAHLLCEISMKGEVMGRADTSGLPLRLTQTDMSDALGLSTVHVNRSLQQLKADGLITLRNHVLVIHDRNALAAIAEFDPAYLHLGRRDAA